MSLGAAIIATFGGDTKDFDRAADRVQSKGKQVFSTLQKAASFLGVGLAIGQLNKITEEMDRIGKTASSIGIAAEELQRLQFAGQQTGVATEKMNSSLERFVRRIQEARNGTGEASEAVQKYGIRLNKTNGEARSNEAILNDVSDVMAGMKTQAERVALAFDLFGREGVKLANTLKDGSAELNKLKDAATGVFTEDDIKRVERYNDRMNELGRSLKATAGTLFSGFLGIGEAIGERGAFLLEVAQGRAEGALKALQDRENAPNKETATDTLDAINVEEAQSKEAERLAAIEKEKLAERQKAEAASAARLKDRKKLQENLLKIIELRNKLEEEGLSDEQKRERTISRINQLTKEAQQIARAANGDAVMQAEAQDKFIEALELQLKLEADLRREEIERLQQAERFQEQQAATVQRINELERERLGIVADQAQIRKDQIARDMAFAKFTADELKSGERGTQRGRRTLNQAERLEDRSRALADRARSLAEGSGELGGRARQDRFAEARALAEEATKAAARARNLRGGIAGLRPEDGGPGASKPFKDALGDTERRLSEISESMKELRELVEAQPTDQ